MKKIILLLLIFISFTNVYALELPTISSSNLLIYDISDDKVLYDIGASEVRTVASLTKILSVLTAIENIDDIDMPVTITNAILNTVPWDAYKIGLKENEIYTMKELMIASINRSGADAVNAMALNVSKSIKDFAVLMNNEAKKIGMNDSHFSNAIGMDGNNYSTANDIKKLLVYAIKNEKFLEIFSTPSYSFGSDGLDFSSFRDYLNKKLNKGSYITGYKTGFTESAGNCFAVYFVSNTHEYIMVTLNAKQTEEDKMPNMTDAVNLINFLSEGYDIRVLLTKNEIVKTIPVKEASITEYSIYLEKDIDDYLGIDYDPKKVNIVYEGYEYLTVKNKVGEKIGNIKVYYDNKLLYEKDCYLKTKIKYTINQFIKHYKLMYILIIIYAVIVFKKIFFPKRSKVLKKKQI